MRIRSHRRHGYALQGPPCQSLGPQKTQVTLPEEAEDSRACSDAQTSRRCFHSHRLVYPLQWPGQKTTDGKSEAQRGGRGGPRSQSRRRRSWVI